jgi:hypothetical protein
MAYDEALAARIRDLVSGEGGVTEQDDVRRPRVPRERQHGRRRERPGRDPVRVDPAESATRRDDAAEEMVMRGRAMKRLVAAELGRRRGR